MTLTISRMDQSDQCQNVMSKKYLHSNLTHPCQFRIGPRPLLQVVKQDETVMISEAISALTIYFQAIQTPPGNFPHFARLALSSIVQHFIYQHSVNINSYVLFAQPKIVILCLNRYYYNILSRSILIFCIVVKGIINSKSS